MNYRYKMFLKALTSMKFIGVLVIIIFLCFFGLITFLEEGIEYFFKHDYIYAFLQGYNGDRALLVALAPIIATIPYATRHIENTKSGFIKYIVVRMGYKKYFDSIFLVNMMLAAFVFFIGMLIFLFISFFLFSKNINQDMYINVTKLSAYKNIANISSILFVFVIIVHCSFISMAFASLGLASSFFIKNKFVAWVFPFFASTIFSLFAIFVNLTLFEPMSMFDVSRVKGTDIFNIILFLLVTIGGSYIVSLLKFKKDLKADEEI